MQKSPAMPAVAVLPRKLGGLRVTRQHTRAFRFGVTSDEGSSRAITAGEAPSPAANASFIARSVACSMRCHSVFVGLSETMPPRSPRFTSKRGWRLIAD